MPADRTVTDLTQQHPVNFTYNAALANAAGLLVPASKTSVDGAGEIPLFQGKMQCATCHDPHNASGIMTQAFPPTQPPVANPGNSVIPPSTNSVVPTT